VSTRAHGGIAPCDALGWLADDLAQTSPDIVVFAFSGNSLTDCMRQGDGSLATDDAIVARYRDDLEFAIRMSVSAGTPFVLASPPASQSSPEDWLQIDELYRDVVARHAPYAQYADAGLDIAPGGRFVTEQRCLPFELSVPEVSGTCDTDNPTISVRAEDGVHFCGDVVEGTAGACTTYSSGALRYAVALVTAAKIDLEYMASVPDIVPQRVGSP
jgi:hypothetical protein